MTSYTDHRLFHSWLLALIVSMAIVVAITGVIGLKLLEERLIRSAGENLAQLAAEVADKLSMQLNESSSDIKLLGDTASHVTWDQGRWTAHLNAVKTAYKRYQWLALIGPTGRIIATTDETSIGKDVNHIAWFTDVLRNKATSQVRDLGPDEMAGGMDTVGFVASPTDFQGAVVGEIGAPTLEAILTQTIHNRLSEQSGIEGFQYQVMNQQGDVFIDSDLDHKGNVNLKAIKLPSALQASLGKSGYIEEEDLRRHVQVITGYAQLPGLEGRSDIMRWGVLVRLNREVVLAPVRSLLWETGLGGGAIFLMLLIPLLWMVRHLARSRHREQATHAFLQSMLATVEAFFICVNREGKVTMWTPRAESIFNISLSKAIGQSFTKLPISWNGEALVVAMEQSGATLKSIQVEKLRLAVPNGKEKFVRVTVSPICDDHGVTHVLMGEDISDRLALEHDLVLAQKLESIGHLAAGIAHEINTPTQFVGDNVGFFSTAFADLVRVLAQYQGLLAAAKTGVCPAALIETCEAVNRGADLEYLLAEIPKALEQSKEGIDRVATIVRAMKEFSHPGSKEKTAVNLNKAIESTVIVARNEWKYVADLQTHLDPSLPPVPCLVGEFNQVVLNMIINATHAIADAGKGTGGKGTITISTSHVGDCVEVRIADTGMGIPESIRHKIFDPFFTTKEVGQGTGQG
ncbi:MAG: ATP-binding protein, partial [Nitrospirota bacterium]